MIFLPTFTPVIVYPTPVGGGTPWTPANATTLMWWDFSDTNNTTIVSSFFSAVADKSGNGFNLSQASSGTRPDVVSQNGLNAASFTGDDVLNRTVSQSISGFHIFAATSYTGTAGQTGSLRLFSTATSGGADASTGGGFALLRPSTTSNIAIINTSATFLASSSIGTSTLAIVSASHSGSQAAISINGNTATTTSNTFSTRTLSILSLGATTVNTSHWLGRICEVVIYSSAQSTDITDRTVGYLAHKWGTTSSLPSGHPYKNSAPTI